MSASNLDPLAITRIASLEDPHRRRLYEYVSCQPQAEVSRDQAAAAAGISRGLAAFHLDKLVEVGLLEACYRRLGERRGPGAGRPAKLYRRAAESTEVALPQREYAFAAALLAETIEGDAPEAAIAGLHSHAARRGREMGMRARAEGEAAQSGRPGFTALEAALAPFGFEPRAVRGEMTLLNCPFEGLSRAHPELICGMNLQLLGGVVEGLGLSDLLVCLDPQPGRCCVTFQDNSQASFQDSFQDSGGSSPPVVG